MAKGKTVGSPFKSMRESRIETQQGSRIEDRESSVNFLLNGTVGHNLHCCPVILEYVKFVTSNVKRRCGNYQSQTLHYQQKFLLWVTRRARNPNLKVVITHTSHVCSQHLFGLPLRMNGVHRTQFDHSSLELLSFVISSPLF